MAFAEFTLKRMNHSRSLIQFFEGLMESSFLVDCTIAAEGQYLKAHRVILSACSPYFEMLFSQENEKDPIVILTDTKFEVLKAVIDFIYRGQINIPQDQLKCFVAAIESLQIIGMENGSENIEETGIRMQLSSSSVQTEWPECNSVSSFRTENETKQESSTESFPIENKFQVKTEEGIVETTQVYERSDEIESLQIIGMENGSENIEETGIRMQLSSSSVQTEWPECNSVSSFRTENETKQESSTESFPIENKFQVKTEEGIVETTQVYERSDENAEESIAACCIQTDAYHFEKSASSDGPPNASGNSAHSEFCLGATYVPDTACQLTPLPSLEQNLPNVVYSTSWAQSGVCSVETNGVDVHEISISEKCEEKDADHCNMEVNNSESADEFAEESFPVRHSTSSFPNPLDLDALKTHFHLSCHLKEHKRTGMVEKSYLCDECGVFFSQSRSLKKHKRTHTGERPYRCDECGVSFSESGTLRKHKLTHTGEKPYRCDECGVSFSQSGSLRKHKRIHTGERPYRCAYCGVSFRQSGNLKEHKRIHTGERPYRCADCGVSFSQAGNLKTHIRTHTGAKPYCCANCGVSFSQSGSLKKHIQTHR